MISSINKMRYTKKVLVIDYPLYMNKDSGICEWIYTRKSNSVIDKFKDKFDIRGLIHPFEFNLSNYSSYLNHYIGDYGLVM